MGEREVQTPEQLVAAVAAMYNVAAEVGGTVRYTGGSVPRFGTIKSAYGARLLIVLDGEKKPRAYHPTWELEYIEDTRGQLQG